MKKMPKGVPNPTVTRVTTDAELSVAGAVAGAALGSIAGPPGIAAGAAIGAVAGIVSGEALAKGASRELAKGASREEEHERELDDEIGINGEGLGAPGLKHPPARIGAFSAGIAGAGGSGADDAPAAGPLGNRAD